MLFHLLLSELFSERAAKVRNFRVEKLLLDVSLFKKNDEVTMTK